MPSKPSPKGDRRTVRIGKYEVVKRLPAPDGAAVYRAKDVATGQEVCLRILPPELVAQPGVLDRLRREADKVRKLRHEYLVPLRELGEDHRTYFLARDYVEGSDVAAYVQAHGKLNPGEACRLLSQAAEALGEAHERGILHGHLQPGSFLITRAHGRPAMLLADLGPSLESPVDGENRPARGHSPYLAPEQIRDPAPTDARTDLYALGCALFHLLAGRPPFAEGAAVEQRLQREPPDVRPLNPQVTPALAAVLRKLLARKIEDRYEGVPALLEDLQPLIPAEEHEGPEEGAADLAGLDEGEEDESPAAKLAALERGRHADAEEEGEDEEDERHVRAARRPAPAARETFDELAEAEEEAGTEEAKEKAPWKPPRALIIAGAVAGGVVLLGVVFALISVFSSPSARSPRLPSNTQLAAGTAPEPRSTAIAPDNQGNPQPGTPQPGAPQPGASQEHPAGSPTGQGTAVVQEPPKPSWPVLYQPKKLVPFNDLLKQYEAPWAEGMDFPGDTPVFHVNRLTGAYSEGGKRKTEGGSASEKKEAKPEGKGSKPAGDDKKDKGGVKSDSAETKAEAKEAGERWFDSLAAACAAVPEGQPTTIEIADNGPLFEPAIALNNRRVSIRAAEGYHPLVVWDVAEAKEPKKAGDVAAFLTVTKGQLLLGHVNVALKWAEPPAESVAVVRATDSEVLLWNTAVSVESRHKGGVAAVRFDGTAPGKRCRLSACLTRGEDLVAVDVRAPRAEVLMDGCLLVGGRPPLLQVEGRKDATPTLRAIRSTLVSGETLLQARGAAADPAAPALHWMGWDSLLARAGTDEGGTLLDLPPAATAEAVQWQAANCLYAGWKTLLSGRKPLDVTDLNAWHERWGMAEGEDLAIPNPWKEVAREEPATVTPEIYTPVGTPMTYKALYDEGLLGCNLAVLPTVTDNWPVRTVERFAVPSVEMLAYDALPPIPKANDGKYYGEVLDLDKKKVDLGEYLKEVQKKQKLGASIVLRLRGTGEHKTSPIRLQGSSLVLCFEAPVDPAQPLVLVPEVKTDPLRANPPQYGTIQVEAGNLELLGVDIRCPDFKTALLPPYLLVVQYGNLRIHRSRLQGPLAHPPEGYWGLIRVEGSGQWHPDYVRGFTLNKSLLVSGKMGVHVFGFGWRGRVQNSVVVAGTDAFHFQPTPTAPYRLNTQLTLERTTVAAKRGVVYLEDTPQLPLVVEPVVVQTKDCAFVNPFAGPEGKGVAEAGMVVHQGYPLQRGLLCWQGEGDAFDRRLQFYALPARTGGAVPPLAAAQPFALWNRLWGPLGERGPHLDVAFKGTLDPENLALDPLELPGKGPAVGADLKQLLGIKKK